MLKVTVVFLAAVSVCFAAVALMKPDPKPDKFKNLEGCYIKALDAVVPFGKAAPSTTSCMEYRCQGDLVQIASCGAVGTSEPCKLVYYDDFKERPYPNCCPTVSC